MTTTPAAVYYTLGAKVPYLTHPGVALLATPSFDPEAIRPFLDGFGETFDTDDYVGDFYEPEDHPGHKLDGGEALAKFAGQLCYLSFGPARTRNVDVDTYFAHIKDSGHGSVFEHATYSLLLYGIDRATTHEIVRHRAGMAYSQVSQRYVSGKTLRFVERPEFQDDDLLHRAFMLRAERAAADYDQLASILATNGVGAGLAKTEQRKAVNQAARACLPNETEAPLVMTGNARAWRNFLDQRATRWADKPIRQLAHSIHATLVTVAPNIFGDYLDEPGPWYTLATPHRKV